MSNETQNIIDTYPTRFAAIPVELNNYYPFGLPEAGRSWSYQGEIFGNQSKYQDYTYGYNGMQRDNAKGVGSGYTTLFREYDPEIARWKSLDPKLKELPSVSPFSAMGNNPINRVDPNGMKDKEIPEDYKGKVEVTDPNNCGVQNPNANCASYTLHNCVTDLNDDSRNENDRGGPGIDNNPFEDLKERGYKALDFDAPNKVGDLVLYITPMQSDGQFVEMITNWTHIGAVTKVDNEGNTTEVESKFGSGGKVFLHHPRDTQIPGNEYSYGPEKPWEQNTDGSKAYYRIYFRK